MAAANKSGIVQMRNIPDEAGPNVMPRPRKIFLNPLVDRSFRVVFVFTGKQANCLKILLRAMPIKHPTIGVVPTRPPPYTRANVKDTYQKLCLGKRALKYSMFAQ